MKMYVHSFIHKGYELFISSLLNICTNNYT